MSALEIDDLNNDADHEQEEGPSWQEASEIGQEAAIAAWAEAARPILEATAASYQSVVTQKELCARVQEDSGVRTKQQIRHWVGDVLGAVATECSNRSEPLLSALCVNAVGSVGDGYAAVVESLTGTAPADGDDHAAAQRLAAYRQFDATGLPEDGGFAALTPRLAGTRDRARKARLAERVVPAVPRLLHGAPRHG